MNWTLKNLNDKKLIHNYDPEKTISPVPTLKIEKISIEKEAIKKVLWVFQKEGIIPGYVEEYEFHHTRKFRFDWAIVDLKIGIEYEGIISKKSRHTSLKGFTNDCTKYNLASLQGWIILRYTALNYNELAQDLKTLMHSNIPKKNL